MTTEITLKFNNPDELDRELRGLIEQFYTNDNINEGEAIETFLALATELDISLDEKVISAFFQRETSRYVARAEGFTNPD